jgi:hypothetical protein
MVIDRIEQSAERDLRNALSKTRTELNHAVGQRDLWNIRIMQLEQNMKNIRSALTKDRLMTARSGEADSVIGLTEAIRTVMRSWGKPMTAQEVRLALTSTGFDLARFRNPAAAIANTLIRMFKAGELVADKKTKAYSFPARHPAFYGDVPNPFGKNLFEMLKEPKGK